MGSNECSLYKLKWIVEESMMHRIMKIRINKSIFMH